MPQSLEIILLILVSIFLFYRLWLVLGNEEIHNGFNEVKSEPQPATINSDRDNKFLENELDLIRSKNISLSNIIEEKIIEIKKIDPNFSLSNFLIGAEKAFYIIVKAFASGNKEILKNLLSDSIYILFSKAIENRELEGLKQDIQIEEVEIIYINNLDYDGKDITITLCFRSKQRVIVINKNGEIIDNPNKLSISMIDIWSFKRIISSKNPNWILFDTKTSDEIRS